MKRKKSSTTSVPAAAAAHKGILKTSTTAASAAPSPQQQQHNKAPAVSAADSKPQSIASPSAALNNGNDTTAKNNVPPVVSSRIKRATFNEHNLRETLHPANKDYGTMKIDEPDTPFVPADKPRTDQKSRPVDAEELKRKLLEVKRLEELATDAEADFVAKRREHYDEFKRAKHLPTTANKGKEDKK